MVGGHKPARSGRYFTTVALLALEARVATTMLFVCTTTDRFSSVSGAHAADLIAAYQISSTDVSSSTSIPRSVILRTRPLIRVAADRRPSRGRRVRSMPHPAGGSATLLSDIAATRQLP